MSMFRVVSLISGVIALYALLIMLFSIIYYLCPNSFIQSNSLSDPAYDEELERLQLELGKDLNRIYNEDPMYVSVSEFKSLGPHDGYQFRIDLTHRIKIFNGEYMWRFSHFNCIHPQNFLAFNMPKEKGGLLPSQWIQFKSPNVEPTKDIDNEVTKRFYQADYDCVAVQISQETRNSIQALIEAADGNTDRLGGRFLRMWYFSAVTMATIGYGDLVPKATSIRILIWFQSVLGIILAALLGNACWEFSRRWVMPKGTV